MTVLSSTHLSHLKQSFKPPEALSSALVVSLTKLEGVQALVLILAEVEVSTHSAQPDNPIAFLAAYLGRTASFCLRLNGSCISTVVLKSHSFIDPQISQG